MGSHCSDQYKIAVVRKLAASSLSVRQFAQQEGVAYSTLHKWRNQFKMSAPNQPLLPSPEDWSLEEKFAVVLESASLSEVELGQYCRCKGLYPEQLRRWKQSCIEGNMTTNDHKKQQAAQAKSDKKRIKQLERELKRKDKALAEAAALLVLSKKLNALWEEDGDE